MDGVTVTPATWSSIAARPWVMLMRQASIGLGVAWRRIQCMAS